jgi:hypothetical protein
MEQQRELKVLRHLNEMFSNNQKLRRRKRIKRIVTYAVSWMVMAIAFGFVMQGEIAGIVAVGLAAVAGIFAGGTILCGDAEKVFPIIEPHISQESIVARIKQLET